MESYLPEYNRMTGVGPSLLEATAADPMLSVLAKAFSVKAVKPQDVKYLRYRKVGHGVELEDTVSKFGGILTSVEPKDADPKALVAYLKKHGSKPAPKVESVEMTEKTKRDWYQDGRNVWRKEGSRFEAVVSDHGRYAEWHVSTVKGTSYSTSGHAANVEAAKKACEQGARKLAQEIKDERAHMKRVKTQPKRARPERGMPWESVEESVYRVLGPGPKAGGGTDVVKFCADITSGVQSAVRGKFFRCVPNLKFGIGGANIDYANIPATAQPGSLDFLNAKVQVRLTVDGFDAEGNLKGSKVKVTKLTSPRGIKFRAKTGTLPQVVKHIVTTIKKAAEVTESLDEAKSGFEVKIIHSKHNSEVVKVEVTGTFRGDEIIGRTPQIHLGIDTFPHGWVSFERELTINRPDSGKKVPDGFRTKIAKAALAKLIPLARKLGNKEFAESIEEALLAELKFDDSKIDPKKHGKPGKPYFVVQSHNTGTIYKPRVFKKGNIKKRAGDYARELAAKSKKLNPAWAWIKIDLVRDIPPVFNPHGISFSQSVRASMYRYIDGVWKHKDGPTKISGLNEDTP